MRDLRKELNKDIPYHIPYKYRYKYVDVCAINSLLGAILLGSLENEWTQSVAAGGSLRSDGFICGGGTRFC